MNMREHILAALQEQFEAWEELLANRSQEQLTSAQFDLNWSIKDVMAHLWAWQQVSVARLEAGVQGREPEYPQWLLNLGEDWEADSDRVNALTFQRNHEKPGSRSIKTGKVDFCFFWNEGPESPNKTCWMGTGILGCKGIALHPFSSLPMIIIKKIMRNYKIGFNPRAKQ